jgi:hypothetical protein
MRNSLSSVKRFFRYQRDRSIDTWRILGPADPHGDCDDFAVTLLFWLCNGSMLKFWIEVITFRSVFWLARSYQGNLHIILWHRSMWADNMEDRWYTTGQMRHKRLLPLPFPIVLMKMAIGKLLG